MKATRKILTLLIAMVMILSFSVTAFAQDVTVGTGSGSITISNTTKDQSYSIFKLFDATVSADGENIVYKLPSGKTAANINNDDNAKNWFEVSDAGEVSAKEALTEAVLKSDAFKTWAEGFGTQISATTKATENSLTFKDIPYGYYLVKSTLGTLVTVDSINPDATVIDKNQEPGWDNGENNPGKVIVEKDEEQNEVKTTVNEANLNEDILFDIGVSARNFNGQKKIFAYVITDDLDAGMSYRVDATHPLTVTVGSTLVQPESASNPNGYTIVYYDKPYSDSTKAVTTYDKAQSFRITIPWTDLTKVDATAEPPVTAYDAQHLYDNATEIHVRYTGFLDPAKAAKVEYKKENENKANFTWLDDDNKNDNPKETTPDHSQPEKKTETYVTELELFKFVKNGENKNALEGAEFTLTGTASPVIYTEGTRFAKDNDEGAYWLLNDGTYTTTDPNGAGVNQSLYASTTDKYKKESFTEVQGTGQTDTTIKAYVDANGKLTFHGLAEGTYTLTESVVPAGYNKAADITFKVVFDKENKTFSVNPESSPVKFDSTSKQLKVEVENSTGSELPSTGGIGTTLFYVVGSILVIAAVVLFVTKKRMNTDAEH